MYGNQRLWGSIGWGVFSIIAGFMVDSFSESDTNKDYTSVFYLMLGMMVLDLIVSFRLKVSRFYYYFFPACFILHFFFILINPLFFMLLSINTFITDGHYNDFWLSSLCIAATILVVNSNSFNLIFIQSFSFYSIHNRECPHQYYVILEN